MNKRLKRGIAVLLIYLLTFQSWSFLGLTWMDQAFAAQKNGNNTELVKSKSQLKEILKENEKLEVKDAEYRPGELVVRYKPQAKSKSLTAQRLKAVAIKRQEALAIETLRIPNSINLNDAILEFKNDPNVEYVHLNYAYEKTFIPNDPYFSNQWHLNSIKAPQAWDINQGSSLVTIAVLDTGIDLNHPDLKQKIEKPWNAVEGNLNVQDIDGHGTHVAGIAAASFNNGIGIAGIGGNVKIMPVNVFSPDGKAYDTDIAEGIIYAVNNGAKIINLSLGGPVRTSTLESAIEYAWTNEVLVIAAAGNDSGGPVLYPARYTNAMAVSAVDANKNLASFSNFGPQIEVAAPGVSILSTFWDKEKQISSYVNMSGTSMAAPLVSGLAALLWSNQINLSNVEVRQLIKASADDIGDLGFDDQYGYGVINAHRALTGDTSTIQPTPDPVEDPFGIIKSGEPVTNILGSSWDIYEFQNLEDGKIQLNLTSPSTMDGVLVVFNETLDKVLQIVDKNEDGGVESATAYLGGGKTYYIAVLDYWGRPQTSSYNLALTHTPTDSIRLFSDSDDSKENATPIDLNDNKSGKFMPSGDVDIYKVNTSGPGELSIGLNTSSDNDGFIYLFDSTMTDPLDDTVALDIADSQGFGGSENLTYQFENEGTYYLVVGDFFGTPSEMDYSISTQYKAFNQPKIEIFTPVDNFMTDGSSIQIEGLLSYADTVLIQEEAIAVNADGTFSKEVSLSDGINSILVEATNEYGTASVTRNVIVDKNPPVATISINNNEAETSNILVTLQLSAEDEFSQDLLMRFSNDNQFWTEWESYMPIKDWTLTDGAGPKIVFVQLKDSVGNISTYSSSIGLAPIGSAEISNLELDEELFIGKVHLIRGTAIASTKPLYQFWLKDYSTGKWQLLQNYSENNTYNWIPEKTGKYRIELHVKDVNSNSNYDDNAYKDIDVKEPIAKVTEFTVGSNFYEGYGSTISGSGVSPNKVLYKFWIKDYRDGKWQLLQNYSENSTLTWIPEKAGKYRIEMHVKDERSTQSFDHNAYQDVEVKTQAQISAFTVADNFYIGKNQAISGQATAVNKPLYQFWLKDYSTGKWSLLQNYSENNTFNWVPEKKGKYRIELHVKDVNSNSNFDDSAYKDIEVKEPTAKITEFTVASTLYEGYESTISSSGTSPNKVLYQFWVKDYSTGKWQLLQNYSENNTIKWAPEKIGKYRVELHVKDEKSQNTYDHTAYQDVQVNKPANITSFQLDDIFYQGKSHSITGQATAVNKPLYQFWLKDYSSGKWELLRNYGEISTFNWIPDKLGKYRIELHVKDEASKNNFDALAYKDIEVRDQYARVTGFNVASNLYLGHQQTVSGSATSANKTLYKFWIKDYGLNKWTMVQNYSEKSTFTWKPDKPGKFRIEMHVKDDQSEKFFDQNAYKDITVGELINTTNSIYTYEKMVADLGVLKNIYGSQISLESIGKSVLKKDIWAIRIGNPNAPKKILVNGSTHAREYMTTPLAMKQLEFYLTNPNAIYEGKKFSEILQSVSIYFVPMVNPDGVTLSQKGLPAFSDAALRTKLKNLNGGSTDFSRWKANINGVDINRNYNWGWDKVENSIKPGPLNYKGPSPVSEPETKAMVAFTNKHKFSSAISYHSTGSVIYWYYGQRGALYDRDKARMEQITKLTGYAPMAADPKVSGYAGYGNWYSPTYSATHYTIEIGRGATPLSASEFPDIWKRNKLTAIFLAHKNLI